MNSESIINLKQIFDYFLTEQFSPDPEVCELDLHFGCYGSDLRCLCCECVFFDVEMNGR